MNRDLPLLMNCWLNAPLACTDAYALTAASVFSGRLDIRSIQDQYRSIGPAEMAAMAEGARIEADAKRARRIGGKIIECTGNIAVIRVYGALTRTWGIGPYSGATGYDGIRRQLEEALLDPEIDGVWLDIDSGGGTVNGLMDLADTIFSWRSTQKPADRVNDKPIWAMAADYAYSAAYLLGTSCDRFFCPEDGGCASIGTIAMHTSYARANDMEGIDVTVLRDPPLKNKTTSAELLDEKTIAHLMEQLRQLTASFQSRVVRNLKVSKSAVADTQGRDYTGLQSKAIGLVTDALPETIVWEMFRSFVGKRR